MAKSGNVQEIAENAFSLAESLLKKKVEAVTSVTRTEKGWVVLVEVLERKAVPDTQDIIAKYEFKLAGDGDLVGYKRVELRRRGDMGPEEVEE